MATQLPTLRALKAVPAIKILAATKVMRSLDNLIGLTKTWLGHSKRIFRSTELMTMEVMNIGVGRGVVARHSRRPVAEADPGNPTQTTVSRDQCIAHLKFLAALADLRDTIASRDGLFGIFDSQVNEIISKKDDERTRHKALAILRERRWMVYVARAVDRYTTWWERCVAKTHQDITVWDTQQPSYASITQWATPLPFGPENLPPLDVLMVWHAHMLNRRAFLEDCIRGARMGHWATQFPWRLINDALDNENFDYNPPNAARCAFEERTQRPWDNLNDSATKTLSCLRCGSPMPVLWAVGKLRRRSSEKKKSKNKVEEIDEVEFEIVNDTGYAEKNFQEQCENSGFLHTHQKLRVARFHSDAQQLVERQLPMPGTLYDEHGVPSPQQDHTFPNLLIVAESEKILRLTDPRMVGVKSRIRTAKFWHYLIKAKSRSTNVHTMMGLRDLLQSILESMTESERKPLLARGSHCAAAHDGALLGQQQRDLRAGPCRRRHPPRHIRPENGPHRLATLTGPALDNRPVDLQLSAKRYFAFSTPRTQAGGSAPIFIDHDDKVDETRLTEGFEWTAMQYRKLTKGGIYSECTCCQAEALYSNPNVSDDPERNAHIPAHNAVRVDRLRAMQLRTRYLHAYRRAEKRRRGVGDGDNRNSRCTVWGYPYYMPYYAPYMCDPGIHGDMHACNPTCMNLASASHGNCIAGMCGGAVAAGSCGGNGGTCAGGHAGCEGGGGIGGCGGGDGGGSSGCGGGGGGGRRRRSKHLILMICLRIESEMRVAVQL
ncbi:hypothetical protein VTN49DRAFT_2066 [Thermomyces lanuginosus]|uniref:uncharacterized protein n=1 Tax=Thermomyces lanuginosus TaxID=5541 RepID=UPI0037429F6C